MKFLLTLLALTPALGFASNFPNYFDPLVSSTSGGGGSTSPGGSSGQVQFNNAGSFGGMTNSVVSGNNISFGGNISAPSATFTNIADTALTSGTMPVVTGGGLFIDSGLTWTASVLSVAGGVSATTQVSASQFSMGDGTATAPSLYFRNSTQTGWYRAGNNQPNMTIAGSVVQRLSGGAMAFMTGINTASATFHVGTSCQTGACPGSGMFAGQLSANTGSTGTSVTVPNGGLYVSGSAYITGSISTTAYVNVGSPTTLPTCNALNKGNVFMNTTTNCLNYCNGTSNIQVTSAAGTCT